ncbi:Cell division protein FtsI [Peptidoglycan synthetase] [hydrothermal vent metagenome]|uniref:Cell division protein FtsI [Peptidoglycan synthetase] n=1 Tax=hydrothermal vent metagenome TaxID=652676 RepID=A0A1W1C1F7_9ZZZZ
MVSRLYNISIKSNYFYERLAKENVEQSSNIKPTRGEILDSSGKLLASNKIGFSLFIKPHMKLEGDEFKNILELLQHSFKNIDTKLLRKVYKKKSSPYNHKYIQVIDFIPYDEMIKVYPKLSLNSNIKVDAATKRYYPYGRYLAHVVGYIGKANKKDVKKDKIVKIVGKIGKAGLERYYNKVLQGELGSRVVKVNAYNKELELLKYIPPKSNRNIKLSVDADLQKFIYDTVEDENKTAVVIVMKTTGELLAAVSTPSYDPNLFVDGISVKDWKKIQSNLEHPFTNKLVHALYPPGSTIKMGVALATSKEAGDLVLKHEFCKGYITIGKSKHKFRCWSHWGHGDVDLRKSIRESCDVFYYDKALDIGIDKLSKDLNLIGLGVRTGVDLPREYKGIIPNKKWKRKRYKQSWYKGETVIAAIGQGYDNVTLMQIARYTAFLATGYLVTPHFATLIDNKPYESKVKKIHFNPLIFQTIRNGMFDVCNNRRGTAYRVMHNLPIIVAGKTGTAQVASVPQDVKKRVKEADLSYFKRSHAWLTTYAPFDKPKYIVSIIVEHGGHGGSTAGPIAAKIYRWMYQKGYFGKQIAPKLLKEIY